MTEVLFQEDGVLGVIFHQEDQRPNGMCEIIHVHRGSASERLGVQVGWLVEKVAGVPMGGRSLAAVTVALQSLQRPLQVQFALQSATTDMLLGGGWLCDVPLALPGGRVVNVSVATQDTCRCAASLKLLLLAQHGAAAAAPPVEALSLVTELHVMEVGLGGLGGTKHTGEVTVVEIGDLTSLKDITLRIERGELLSVRVAAPHRWPGEAPAASAPGKWSPQPERPGSPQQCQLPAADWAELQQSKQVVPVSPTPLAVAGGAEDSFELSFVDGPDESDGESSIVGGMRGLELDKSIGVE